MTERLDEERRGEELQEEEGDKPQVKSRDDDESQGAA